MERQINQQTPLEREWQSLYKFVYTYRATITYLEAFRPTSESYKTYYTQFIEHESDKVKEHIRVTSQNLAFLRRILL